MCNKKKREAQAQHETKTGERVNEVSLKYYSESDRVESKRRNSNRSNS